MTTRVADMTVEELEALIDRVLERKILTLMHEHRDSRTLEEVYESIDRNMWTPPPGAPAPHELIRKSRDG